MKRIPAISSAILLLLCGCQTATKPPRATAEDHLLQDGKLLYELGRYEEAQKCFTLVLAQTSNEQLRERAKYFHELICAGIPTVHEIDNRTLRCF